MALSTLKRFFFRWHDFPRTHYKTCFRTSHLVRSLNIFLSFSFSLCISVLQCLKMSTLRTVFLLVVNAHPHLSHWRHSLGLSARVLPKTAFSGGSTLHVSGKKLALRLADSLFGWFVVFVSLYFVWNLTDVNCSRRCFLSNLNNELSPSKR